jgi:CheY-like chemotaxis protein
MKVLVIEDNPIDQKLARAVVQVSGLDCIGLGSAAGALEVVRSYKPDVILVDLNLPGIDGLRFARELQWYVDTRDIPIVAVTAYPSQYRMVDVLSAGCAGYIVKPIETRELVDKLRSIVAKPTPDGSSQSKQV